MRANAAWMRGVVRSGEMRKEIQWLQHFLQSSEPPAPSAGGTVFDFSAPSSDGDHWRQVGARLAYELVFCHNDLLCGNILKGSPAGPDSITLIDYEYAGYNPAAFDIANHFCGKCLTGSYIA